MIHYHKPVHVIFKPRVLMSEVTFSYKTLDPSYL
jgi:hypothetical protein